MSPFDWTGPEFLIFYIGFGIAVLFGLYFSRSFFEGGDAPPVNFSDPYLIAYLRGGANEAIRVATVSLIDREFLKADKTSVQGIPGRPHTALRIPVEQSVAQFFATGRDSFAAFQDKGCLAATERYKHELERLGLLPDGAVTGGRWLRYLVAIGLLWSVAGYKLMLAAERGRHNIAFLVISAILFTFAALFVSHPRQTLRGKQVVANLKTLFQPLRDRSSAIVPGRNPNDMLMLAAAFGLASIPLSAAPSIKALYPRANASGSCGSSSCGSSCSSSCGGGGCGGGCGGCGS